jgi:hypothetical protein
MFDKIRTEKACASILRYASTLLRIICGQLYHRPFCDRRLRTPCKLARAPVVGEVACGRSVRRPAIAVGFTRLLIHDFFDRE